jgi:prepilin peptidase CpaA
MGMTAQSADWLLPAVLPFALYISWNDMRSLKITNKSVLALVVVFAVVGPFAFGFETYLWQWIHLPITLVVCMALWALRLMGGGDAKMIAAMSPFVMLADLTLVLFIFASCLIAALIAHSLFRFTPLRKLAPDWKSWHGGPTQFPESYTVTQKIMVYRQQKFPKGFPLSMTLVFYLTFVAFYR